MPRLWHPNTAAAAAAASSCSSYLNFVPHSAGPAASSRVVLFSTLHCSTGVGVTGGGPYWGWNYRGVAELWHLLRAPTGSTLDLDDTCQLMPLLSKIVSQAA
jgi:hypothetical protein